jgi:hypothetical protein
MFGVVMEMCSGWFAILLTMRGVQSLCAVGRARAAPNDSANYNATAL